MENFEYIKRNLENISRKVDIAAKKAGRSGRPNILLATKYATPEEMNYAASLGYTLQGENRVQSLLEKIDRLDPSIEMHFIGSLQKNKVKYIIDKVSLIHSLDSLSLAEEINKRAEQKGITARALVEINIGNEESKGGISPDKAKEFFYEVAAMDHLKIAGIMTMAPKSAKNEELRKYFQETYHIFIDIFDEKRDNMYSTQGMPILSMGMSESYETATEEGATLLRVGRAAFAK